MKLNPSNISSSFWLSICDSNQAYYMCFTGAYSGTALVTTNRGESREDRVKVMSYEEAIYAAYDTVSSHETVVYKIETALINYNLAYLYVSKLTL